MELNEIRNLLHKEAKKQGIQGSDKVGVKVDAKDIDVDKIPTSWGFDELDGQIFVQCNVDDIF